MSKGISFPALFGTNLIGLPQPRHFVSLAIAYCLSPFNAASIRCSTNVHNVDRIAINFISYKYPSLIVAIYAPERHGEDKSNALPPSKILMVPVPSKPFSPCVGAVDFAIRKLWVKQPWAFVCYHSTPNMPAISLNTSVRSRIILLAPIASSSSLGPAITDVAKNAISIAR